MLTVLHDIANNAKLVKVSTSTLGTKRLLECDLDIVNVIAVPGSAKEFVTESEDEDVLDHLLSEVVVNSENFLLFPVWLESMLEFSRTLKILAKWLFNLDRDVRTCTCSQTHDSDLQ